MHLCVADLYLRGYDEITVARVIGKKWEFLRTFDNSTTLDRTTNVVSDSNNLVVTYAPHGKELDGRFRITYSTLDTGMFDFWHNVFCINTIKEK